MSAIHYFELFLFVILSTSSTARVNNSQISLREKCDLEKLCSYYGEEIMIPDPGDCRYYFLCTTNPDGEVGASSTSKSCDYGTYFDFDEQTCVKETEDFVCTDLCSNLIEDEFHDIASYDNSVDVCSPKNSCTNLGAGYKVPDPDDCTQYYVCIKNATGNVIPSENPVPCKDGMFFDVSSLNCVEEEADNPCYEPCLNVDCVYVCIDDLIDPYLIAVGDDCSKYRVCSPSGEAYLETCESPEPYFDGRQCTSDPYSCCDGCIPYCKEPFVDTVDPNDCTGYYKCEEIGVPSENNKADCGPGYVFNPEISSCEENISCSPRC